MSDLLLKPIGVVSSPVADRAEAVSQGREGAPDTELVIDAACAEAVRDIDAGDELMVLTWLHQADRTVLRVHPRDDLSRPERGVFSTRSADRPNPIGLHRVRVLSVHPGDTTRIAVADMEAIDGTPVVDIKPALDEGRER